MKQNQIVDPSTLTLLIPKIFKDHQAGLINDIELEQRVLKLFIKFDPEEVLEHLPAQFIPFLKKFALTKEPEEDFRIQDCFGSEFECMAFVKNKMKMPPQIKNKLWYFFKSKKGKKKYGS